jgi:hypothetical protein
VLCTQEIPLSAGRDATLLRRPRQKRGRTCHMAVERAASDGLIIYPILLLFARSGWLSARYLCELCLEERVSYVRLLASGAADGLRVAPEAGGRPAHRRRGESMPCSAHNCKAPSRRFECRQSRFHGASCVAFSHDRRRIVVCVLLFSCEWSRCYLLSSWSICYDDNSSFGLLDGKPKRR